MQDKWNDGDAYEFYVGRWSQKVGASFLDWLNAPAGLRWLDLGCGTGALTNQILEACQPLSVTGVEPSEGFLSAARKRVGARRFPAGRWRGYPGGGRQRGQPRIRPRAEFHS